MSWAEIIEIRHVAGGFWRVLREMDGRQLCGQSDQEAVCDQLLNHAGSGPSWQEWKKAGCAEEATTYDVSNSPLLILNNHCLEVLFANEDGAMAFSTLVFHMPIVAGTDVADFSALCIRLGATGVGSIGSSKLVLSLRNKTFSTFSGSEISTILAGGTKDFFS